VAVDLAAVDTVLPETAEDWLRALQKAMQDRRNGRQGVKQWSRHLSAPTRIRPGLDLLNDYLEGDPPLLNYQAGWEELFRLIARLGRLNVAELIINAKSSKMKLDGFRTAAASDDLGDEKAAAIMDANKLRTKSREVHDFQLWAGDAYAMVTPNDGAIPVITAEDPRETITAHDPATGVTRAALKMFRDEWDKADLAHLYIRQNDGTVLHFSLIKRGRTTMTRGVFRFSGAWELYAEIATLPRMPIIRFPNRGGRGEYERHLDTLDRINDQIMSKVVIAKVQAFRQMAIENLPDTVEQMNPTTGDLETVTIDYTDAFEATPGSLWRLPEGAKIWESTPTDLGPLRLSIKDDLENLAAVTQTALPAITPDAASGSAEGAALMREEHVGAVEACRDYAEGGWAEVMATAFAFMGDTERADVTKLKPIWGPVERFSLSERADAASKAVTTLPRAAIQTDIWQYPPREVARLRQLAGADLLGQPAQPANGVPQVTFQTPAPPTGGDGGATA
jgi:hypothetical protein